jgi:hypothetical protein
MSEKALESLIVNTMTASGSGWIRGDSADNNREYAVDLAQFRKSG